MQVRNGKGVWDLAGATMGGTRGTRGLEPGMDSAQVGRQSTCSGRAPSLLRFAVYTNPRLCPSMTFDCYVLPLR